MVGSESAAVLPAGCDNSVHEYVMFSVRAQPAAESASAGTACGSVSAMAGRPVMEMDDTVLPPDWKPTVGAAKPQLVAVKLTNAGALLRPVESVTTSWTW